MSAFLRLVLVMTCPRVQRESMQYSGSSTSRTSVSECNTEDDRDVLGKAQVGQEPQSSSAAKAVILSCPLPSSGPVFLR